jgi:hypothetical protein
MFVDGLFIGGLVVALMFLMFNEGKIWIGMLSDDEPEENEHWTVGDFKRKFAKLPEDMPVILLDTSTDDSDDMNYHFTNQEIEVDDYYRFDTEDYLEGKPVGKALFLYFDNKLNEDPIN